MDKFIEVKNINYKYDKGRSVFENFFIELDSGETTILTGPNGSGKTSLTKLIMGILKPQAGRIRILGKDTKYLTLGEIGETIGYVFQYPERQLFATSVMEELTFPLLFKGENKEKTLNKAEYLIKTFDLEEVKDSFPFFLSYGEKRRLAIASVLMNNPKYLILDEPTASLDSHRIEVLLDILNNLKDEKIGTLIISHNTDFIEEHGDRIVCLERGKIISDKKKRSRP